MESFTTYIFEPDIWRSVKSWMLSPLSIGLFLIFFTSLFLGWMVLGFGIFLTIWELIKISREDSN